MPLKSFSFFISSACAWLIKMNLKRCRDDPSSIQINLTFPCSPRLRYWKKLSSVGRRLWLKLGFFYFVSFLFRLFVIAFLLFVRQICLVSFHAAFVCHKGFHLLWRDVCIKACNATKGEVSTSKEEKIHQGKFMIIFITAKFSHRFFNNFMTLLNLHFHIGKGFYGNSKIY